MRKELSLIRKVSLSSYASSKNRNLGFYEKITFLRRQTNKKTCVKEGYYANFFFRRQSNFL